MGVNLYTFGVALGPPQCWFRPLQWCSRPPQCFFFRFAHFSNAYVHTTLDILAFRGFMFRNTQVPLLYSSSLAQNRVGRRNALGFCLRFCWKRDVLIWPPCDRIRVCESTWINQHGYTEVLREEATYIFSLVMQWTNFMLQSNEINTTLHVNFSWKQWWSHSFYHLKPLNP